jgi:hypothetical protein
MREEHAADAQFGAGRLGEVLAERQCILPLVAAVIADNDLAVQERLVSGDSGQRPAAIARS